MKIDFENYARVTDDRDKAWRELTNLRDKLRQTEIELSSLRKTCMQIVIMKFNHINDHSTIIECNWIQWAVIMGELNDALELEVNS